MNDTEFHARVTALLDAIEAQADHWFDQLDLDVETKRQGTVLNLIFAVLVVSTVILGKSMLVKRR
jgi:CyaY protein